MGDDSNGWRGPLAFFVIMGILIIGFSMITIGQFLFR